MKQTNFKHRCDYNALQMALPPEKFNSTHIAMETTGFGCDENRTYVLSNLALCNAASLQCLICRDMLSVYDQFPLINGLMFQSPCPYSENKTADDYAPPYLKIDGEKVFIHAVCVACAQQEDISFECIFCSKPWDGSNYQLGNLIKFDIFAAQPCCPDRVTCARCKHPLGDVRLYRPFSFFSKYEQCNYCGFNDFHCIKPMSTYRLRISSNSELNSMMQSNSIGGSNSFCQFKSVTGPAPSPVITNSNGENGNGQISPKSSSPAQQLQNQQRQEIEKKKVEKEKTKRKEFGSCAMDEVQVRFTRKT
jgi:hypothetical protein